MKTHLSKILLSLSLFLFEVFLKITNDRVIKFECLEIYRKKLDMLSTHIFVELLFYDDSVTFKSNQLNEDFHFVILSTRDLYYEMCKINHISLQKLKDSFKRHGISKEIHYILSFFDRELDEQQQAEEIMKHYEL